MRTPNPGLRAVARALIRNSDGDLLLCRSRSGEAWVPPGGTVDPGESLTEAAVREAMEEVGIAVDLGPMEYLQEFRPAGRDEQVIEVAFQATSRHAAPDAALIRGRQARPAGDASDPWRIWLIEDTDGPVREVRWFSQSEAAACPEPIYPEYLRHRFWQAPARTENPYLGIVHGK